jgi:D-threo-aldose 1-dehydrogenase
MGYDPGARRKLGSAPPDVANLGRAGARGIDAGCRRHDRPSTATALQFPRAHPAIIAIIPGALSRAEVLEDASGLEIPAGLWAQLKPQRLLHPAAPAPGAG